MPDKINIDEKLKFAKILSYGEVTNDDIDESINTVARLFHDGKINKVLVDTTKQESVPSVISFYKFSKKFPFGLKIALLATKEQMSFVDLKFFETTSFNKGKFLNIFNSIEDAKNWLFD